MSLTISEIEELVKEMEEDSKALKSEILRICWFMRGGITLEEAYQLDYESRGLISKLVEANLEITKDTKMPFF